jgi:hypothetical protein
MCIEEELVALGAPSKVRQAGCEIDEAHAAKLTPSRELVAYVRDWVTRNRGNNRYGH